MKESSLALLREHLVPSVAMVILLTLLTGLAYPLALTGLAQAAMPVQAGGLAAGAEGQPFAARGYFWSRPSAIGYDGTRSGGSNLGPTSRARHEALAARVAELRAAHPDQPGPVPADLATASASGLDPHLSPEAALYQVGRVARERGFPEGAVRELVLGGVEGRDLGFLGRPRVNVVRLNMALDRWAAR